MPSILSEFMILPYIIYSLSVLTWIIVPFRQYKKRFFIFFLIYGVMDPIVLITLLLLHLNTFRIFIPLVVLSIFSLFEIKTIKNNIFLVIITMVSSLVLSCFGNVKLLRICLMLLDLVTFILFLKYALIEFYKEDHINLFYFMLCVYEISLVLKFMLYIINIKTGVIFLYLTLLFEAFIGIYFIIYNEITSPKIKLKIGL